MTKKSKKQDSIDEEITFFIRPDEKCQDCGALADFHVLKHGYGGGTRRTFYEDYCAGCMNEMDWQKHNDALNEDIARPMSEDAKIARLLDEENDALKKEIARLRKELRRNESGELPDSESDV